MKTMHEVALTLGCALLLSLASAACGAASPRPSSESAAPTPALALDPALAQLTQHEQLLEASTLGVPDCGSACEHLRTICSLSEQICALELSDETQARQTASGGELGARCTDARARCKRARDKTHEACPECDVAAPDHSLQLPSPSQP
jgi:hypothetical protein